MIKLLLPCLLAGLLVVTSCKSDGDPAPIAEKNCKVSQSQLITQKPDGSKDTITTQYEYNSQGYPTIEKAVYSQGGTQTTTYTYNSEGFLTKRIIEGTDDFRQATTYTYAEGKLTQTSVESKSNTSNFLLNHYYLPDGQLSYLVYNGTPKDIDSVMYGYTNGKLTSIREKFDREYGLTDRTYSVKTDTRGLIISEEREDTNKDIYQYNADGAIIRQEHYYSDKLRTYWTHEYDDKKRIEDIIHPLPKGHPAFNFYGLPVHNKTKMIQTYTDPTQYTIGPSSSVYEYEYNADNYPTKVVEKRTFNKETTLLTTTYTVACQ